MDETDPNHVHDTVHSRLVHSRSSSPTGRSIHRPDVSACRALKHTDDNVDLCDLLSSFGYGAKVKLHELNRIMAFRVNPTGLWLRHELFRGRLDQSQFEFSERDVAGDT